MLPVGMSWGYLYLYGFGFAWICEVIQMIDVKALTQPYESATGVHMYAYTGQIFGLFIFGVCVAKWERETERKY